MVVLMLVMTLMEVLALLVLRSKPRRFEVLQCLLSVKTAAAEKFKIHCEKYPPPPPTADINLFKANNGITGTMCEICSKLTIKTTEGRQ